MAADDILVVWRQMCFINLTLDNNNVHHRSAKVSSLVNPNWGTFLLEHQNVAILSPPP